MTKHVSLEFISEEIKCLSLNRSIEFYDIMIMLTTIEFYIVLIFLMTCFKMNN